MRSLVWCRNHMSVKGTAPVRESFPRVRLWIRRPCPSGRPRVTAGRRPAALEVRDGQAEPAHPETIRPEETARTSRHQAEVASGEAPAGAASGSASQVCQTEADPPAADPTLGEGGNGARASQPD